MPTKAKHFCTAVSVFNSDGGLGSTPGTSVDPEWILDGGYKKEQGAKTWKPLKVLCGHKLHSFLHKISRN